MKLTRNHSLWRVLVAAFLTAAAALPSQQTPDPTSPPLSRQQMEEFLLNARILKSRGVPVGITNPERATLSDGTLTHDAHIQDVDISKASYPTQRGMELNFRDSYKFNIAAYRLDKLLGLNMVPVSVERKIRGTKAAVTWWIDDVQMMERERFQKKIDPPDQRNWNDQMYQIRVFNEFIYNTDLNLTNLLITNDWKVWMIDFTRAFRRHKSLMTPERLVGIDRRLYNGLRGLNAAVLKKELKTLLTNSEINGLLARRDLILEHFDKKIAEKGESAVVCDAPGH